HLLSFSRGPAMHTRQESLDLPLRGMIGQDQLLRLRALGDVGDPVIEARRPPPHHRQAAETHPLPALDLRQWLSAGLHTHRPLSCVCTILIFLSRVARRGPP